jgi:hypothetical protein
LEKPCILVDGPAACQTGTAKKSAIRIGLRKLPSKKEEGGGDIGPMRVKITGPEQVFQNGLCSARGNAAKHHSWVVALPQA